MRIAVNTRLLLKDKLEGIGWYTLETLSRIVKSHPEHEFYFLFDRPYAEEFIFEENVHPIVINPPTRHPILWYYWFEIRIPKVLKRLKADLFLSPDGFLSLTSKIPSIAVIHDINFKHHPKDLKYVHRVFYNYFFKKYARRADRIVTVSNFSKADICENYQIEESKIDVSLNGVNANFHPIGLVEQIAVRKKYSEGKDYFLFVGALHPRKNISRLLQAFDDFKSTTNSSNKLLIVGAKMWWNKELQNSFETLRHKNDVIFTGRKSPEELNQLYASAFAFCFVPYFEGFGIPIIEAMKCACPVITSNITAMPEVAGDAALLVNPFDITEITNAMIKLNMNNELRSELSARGQIHSQHFNWNTTAQNLGQSIEKVLSKC
ncbi:MAG: glycosyltransferase family 1 protein [Flavobacteriales bacterium]|nr:glycosyltransferase family 1 protein [Flavobacteriales bacterium]